MIDPKPQLRPSVTHRVSSILPALGLRWSPAPRAGEDAKEQIVGATYTIVADGATGGSYLRLTLTEKVRNASGGTGGVSDKVYNYDGDVYTTLKALVRAINKASHGFQARVLHAPTDLALNNANWTAVSATALPAGGPDSWVSTLVRTGANIDQYLRIGNPEIQDSGSFILVRLQNIVSNATGASGTLFVDSEDGDKVTIRSGLAAGTGWTKHIDNSPDRAEIIRGPLLLQQGATATAGLQAEVTVVQAER